jgi:hypothetical protein
MPSDDDSNAVDLKGFRESIAQIKPLRDTFQHLDDHIARNGVWDKLVWGHLTWYVVRPELGQVDVCTLVAGTMPRSDMTFDPVDIRGGVFRRPLDRVSLTAFGVHVELGPIHEAIINLVREFEAILEPQFEGQPREPSGVLVKMCLQMVPVPAGAESTS